MNDLNRNNKTNSRKDYIISVFKNGWNKNRRK